MSDHDNHDALTSLQEEMGRTIKRVTDVRDNYNAKRGDYDSALDTVSTERTDLHAKHKAEIAELHDRHRAELAEFERNADEMVGPAREAAADALGAWRAAVNDANSEGIVGKGALEAAGLIVPKGTRV